VNRRAGTLLHVLILASYLIFFGSMAFSARYYYAGKPVKFRDAMISGLLSPADNPRGHRIAAAGTALCGLLLLPVAWLFNRTLARRNRPIALAGSLVFGLGPLSAISILFFASAINDAHVYLAFAAYISMTAGLLICLALESASTVRAGGRKGFSLLMVLLFLFAILVFLVWLLFTPDYFDDRSLLRNVAFCEWMLCAIVAVALSGLAAMLTRPAR
jgi:hypothetical protein